MRGLSEEMLKEDSHTDGYKHYASDKLWLHTFCYALSEAYAKDAACDAENKRDNTDDDKRHDKRGHGGIAEASQRDAHGECVDARCYGKGQLRFQTTGIEMVVGIIILERLYYHSSTKKGQ